ncbi:DUF1818 family protein [Halosolutus amylolyticus]|uniref:DUF1818 family protein n=1 Tax=Halosolutus amylolyticus TaxID=2932267 RepID=A0ABD5PQM5_9EURY|nr:DUF1818 family protein [Halosolutus amylolyticus]
MFDRVSSIGRDRRPRHLLLVTCVALLVVTAGCAGLVTDEESGDDVDGDPVAQAPANAGTLVHVDAAALADDGGDRLLADLAAVEGDRTGTGTGVLAFENRTGLDPLAADELLVFDVAPEDEAGVGYVVDGDWTADELVAAIEGTTGVEYDRRTVHDEPVLYEPAAELDGGADDEPAGEATFVGVHGDGRYVVGDEAAVRASLDVRYGDADAVSGPVRDAYDDADDAHVTVASDQSGSIVPEQFEEFAPGLDFEVFDEVEATTRTYDATDDGVAVDAGMHVADEATAAELRDVVRGLLGYLMENSVAQELIAGEEITDELEAVEVTHEGTSVWLSYEGDVDAILRLLDEV